MVKKIGLSIMLLFFFLIIALPIYAWKIEPNLVHVNQVTLGKKNQREPLNVVQLSDIQVSEFYETKRLENMQFGEIMIMVAVLLRCMMKSWRPVDLPL